jgi:hypothetical protein
MKNLLILLLFLTMTGSAIAKHKATKDPFIGTWKFSNQTVINDFQKTFASTKESDIKTEYLTFESNHNFKHDFLDKYGNSVKSFSGKWKSEGEKINISYSGIDFKLSINYFFIDKDLVLGQNFSHVIFTRDATTIQNFASK